MTTDRIIIESGHDVAWIGAYVEEVVSVLLQRSLREIDSDVDMVDLRKVRHAISALQDACDMIVMDAEREHAAERDELDADQWAYNGMAWTDFVEIRGI